jgi:hypothetical protein
VWFQNGAYASDLQVDPRCWSYGWQDCWLVMVRMLYLIRDRAGQLTEAFDAVLCHGRRY